MSSESTISQLYINMHGQGYYYYVKWEPRQLQGRSSYTTVNHFFAFLSFCEFREQLTNVKILAHELYIIIVKNYIFNVMSIIFVPQN